MVADHFVEDILKPVEDKYLDYVLKYTPDKKANINVGDDELGGD